MKRLKANKKKLTPLLNTIDTKSRDIIISIFSQQDQNEKLQYSKNRWRTHKKEQIQQVVHRVDFQLPEPLKTIIPAIRLIANKVDINISSFIFVEGTALQVAYREQSVKVVKCKFQSSKLKYWLSHFYFYRLRAKLALDLLQKKQNTNRETVHVFQEKQYLPGHLAGPINQSAPLVRKLKVSPESNYRRQGEAEKKPFCEIHGKNGRQQVVSFSQALAFADYRFNLTDLVYIRILNEENENDSPILVSYLKKDQKQFDQQLISKFKSVLNRTEGWEYNKNAIQSLKLEANDSKNYTTFAKVLTLQMIAYIETRQFIVVKRFETQWILDKAEDLYLSNVWVLDTSQNQSMIKSGLATLYQKLQTQNSFNPQTSHFRRETSTRYKNFKSQEKHRNSTDLSELPMVSAAKPFQTAGRPKAKSTTKLKPKGNSSIFRESPKNVL